MEEFEQILQRINYPTKIYNFCYIENFGVYFEPGVFDDVPCYQTICADIAQLVRLLPSGALQKLQKDTHIYINKTLTYETLRFFEMGRNCCYHPRDETQWLKDRGLALEKRGCVEINNLEDYLSSIHLWGTGGLLAHEFSHAYHDKFCYSGFDNAVINEAYNVTMRKKLYDNVRVHGPQGLAADGVTSITAKAYACADCKEFFAELSVAYLYALDAHTEYNKWFPFNRAQLETYDRESFSVIESMWI